MAANLTKNYRIRSQKHPHAQKEGIKIRTKLWFRCGFATVLPRQSSWDRRVAKKEKRHTSARCQTIQPISIHLPCSIVVYCVRRQRHTELENKINKRAEPKLHSNEKRKPYMDYHTDGILFASSSAITPVIIVAFVSCLCVCVFFLPLLL